LPDDDLKERERYRHARLTFKDVEYFVIPAPDAESRFKEGGALWFTFEQIDEGVIPAEINSKLSKDLLRYSIFIQEWYASIYIIAREVKFSWMT
jgi:hypothetical protein